MARRDVATCTPDETVAAARIRAADKSWGRCVVVNQAGVVLGVLDEATLANAGDDVGADAVMRLGPATVRAHEDLAGLLQRMHQRHPESVLVTDPDGRLLGVMLRADGDRSLGQSH